MPDRDWWQALWPDPKRVLAAVGVADGMRVVDLCSGDGYFTASMAELVAGSTVLAVELSEELIAAARAEMERAGGPREAARPAVRAAFLAGQVAAWVEPAGFRLREVKEVGPYHYGAIFDAVRGKD